MLFSDLKFIFEIDSTKSNIIDEYSYLAEMLKKSQHMRIIERDQNTDKSTGSQTQSYQQSIAIRNSYYQAAIKEELLLQLCTYLRFKEGYLTVEKVVANYRFFQKTVALKKWIAAVKSTNEQKMIEDQHRWRLHATANQEIDLQAWYHSLFYKEVYRLRGYFWYKDAVLPTYRQSYDLVDNALTPLEEAALAHVLCSPDTTYGDVAGQMFVVQALIPPARFTLFQQLAAQGSNVVKYPRQGRPAKKLFRFSFVEGNIYLTWKGKFGNQGVGIAEVTSVRAASASDMTTWATGRPYNNSHAIPYTLYHTHYTIHTIPFTLYHTHYTIHTILYTIYHIHYTLHIIPYTLYHTHYTLHTIPPTLYHSQAVGRRISICR